MDTYCPHMSFSRFSIHALSLIFFYTRFALDLAHEVYSYLIQAD